MKMSFEPVRGTEDYLPKQMELREYVKSQILKTYKKYGFMQIGTPILENINLLLGSDGGDNLKLIFKVLKRGEKLDLTKPELTERDIVDLGLRYDLTVPMVRMFCNNQNSLPVPFKSIQIDYSFRADRPQRGRGRQFIQCDIDILGDPTCNAEIDILNTTAKTFMALEFENFEIKLNDRRILSSIIAFAGFAKEEEKEICVCLDKLDKIGVDGVAEEMISRGFDANNVQKLMGIVVVLQQKGIESLKDYGVDKALIDEVQKVLASVNALSGGKYVAKYDISIVRGQGYYTGMVYEFYMPSFRGACAGGGRYDNMVENLTGKSVPAVGLGLGFEPTCLLFAERNGKVLSAKNIAVLYRPEDNFVDVLRFIDSLDGNVNGSAILAKKNIGFQLKTLKENGYTHFCMFAEKNIKEI